ncbi:MAG: hypothetical protein BBJ57_13025 [Desulfobacterales bacterium PC51MH44]|nr:MAG: hypothetical protein BBJ57_13025 [Desulfobacterales bacterium PC51MH44]
MSIPRIEKPIFMIGMPRSGTTAISEAISLHRDLGWFSNYLGRVPFLPHLTLLDRITSHPSYGWRLRGKKSQSKSVASFLRRFLPHTDEAFPIWDRCCGDKFLWEYLIGQTATETEKNCISKYMLRVLRYQKKRRFFTKLTGPPRICYLSSIFPDAYFVHVIRDPRGVISSLKNVYFWKVGKGPAELWWKNGMPKEYIQELEDCGKSPAALGAMQWKRVVELTWEERLLLPPEQFIEIRYEDFVQDPYSILRDVFKFLELDDSVEAHQYLSTFGDIRNMNYKFCENLTAEEIGVIERITAHTAHEAGYIFEQ